jgi:hypothetical protein
VISLEDDIPVLELADENDELCNLVLNRVRLLSKRRIAWLRLVWSEVSGGDRGDFNAHTEVDAYLTARDILYREMEWYRHEPAVQDLNRQLRLAEQAIADNDQTRLAILARIFSLNPMEIDIIQLCLAYSIDPNLARVFAYLQDHSGKTYITEALITKLFGYGNAIVLAPDSPLKLWQLVKESITRPGEPMRIDCDPYIRDWLLGFDGLDETLVNVARLQEVKKPLSNWPVDKLVSDCKRMMHESAGNNLRVYIEGSEGSGRRSFAAIVCSHLGQDLLSINADRVPESDWQQVYTIAQRQAFLSNTSLLWFGNCMTERYWPTNVPSVQLQFVIGESGNGLSREVGFEDLNIAIPVIPSEDRLALWYKYVQVCNTWDRKELEEMILRYETPIGQIVSIGQRMTSTIAEAYEALKMGTCHRLGKLAQQMSSSFTFDDLVLPEYLQNGIEDFIFEATDRIQFWEQPHARRLFPQGRSLIGLFSGSPGTGKTMAAQVIAATLKLDLFRIDLSTVVSKYIGESSKNIEQILARAKHMNIVLLFDEADSLFGKRTDIKDAHDRYANTDTNYLLQAIENYPGIIILATNKRSNIDNGFMRRLRYLLEFPKPDAAHRVRIWRRILNELAGTETAIRLDNELIRFANLVEITGAQIKQAILTALFISRRERRNLDATHLLKGLERELAKESKGLGKQVYQQFNQ